MTQPPSKPPVPNMPDLLERLGDPLIVETVVEAYLDCLPERLDAIEVAGQAPDEESLRAAHTLRSASALLGLTPLADACAALETALRTAPSVACPALVDPVLRLADEVRASLLRAGWQPHV